MTFPGEPTGAPFGAAGAGVPAGAGQAGGPAGPAGKRPSAAGYWIGALIVAVGGVGAMIWMFSTILGVFGAVEHYPRVPVPGESTMSLSAGTYKVFAEYPGAGTDFGIPVGVGTIDVTGPNGQPVAVLTPSFNESYNWQGREGRAIAQFVATTSGSYHVKVAASGSGSSSVAQVTVGKGIDASLAGRIVGAIAVGVVALLVGLVVIIVTAVRRSRWRRQHQPPPFAGGYGSGPSYPMPYPGATYGAPGYGAPGYGAPGYGSPGYGPGPAAPTPWPAPGPGAAPGGGPAPAAPPPVPPPSWSPPPDVPRHPPGWGSAPGVPPAPAPAEPRPAADASGTTADDGSPRAPWDPPDRP